MKMTIRRLVCLVLVALLAAAALTLTGCTQKKTAPQVQADSRTELGEGEKQFYFDVTFANEQTASYAIHTDAETVGDALVENDLIEGDESEYGLFVNTVCGETLDWDTDHMFWAFYVEGEFAETGVDSTPITEGATYSFVATKG